MSAIQDVYRTTTSGNSATRRWIIRGSLAIAVFIAIRWGIWNAVFMSSSPDVCRAANGACWAVITSQWKLVLFGTYPFAAIWRPFAATVVLLAAFAVPLVRPSLRVLASNWAGGLVTAIALLDGRPFGLPVVETHDWGGIPLTLLLSEGTILLAFPLGLAVALARNSGSVVLRSLALVAVECIRGVPLVSLLFFATLVMPLFLSGLSNLDKLSAAAGAIVLFNAAYVSEIIRGGLSTVPRGQFEAAESLGVRWITMQRLIVLPQALKVCAPSLVNEAVGIVKDTSLVAVIGLLDLMNASKLTLIDVRWERYFVEVYLVIGLAYFLMCSAVASLGRRLSARLDTAAPLQNDSASIMLSAAAAGGQA
ncbi:amino acid ABC transporter permease [Bradyrhizobium sp. AZCC 2230]|uniref:amino acid ABC transporter permease n=1 Tax=Bradyrhizobium sp. AZCC 2230 TaxID=3117021 RepID=UPI002FF325D1